MKNQEPFLRGYRALAIPIVNDRGQSAWPALFPLSRIDELRATVGARHFQSQMMLRPMAIERARLDPSAIRFYNDEFDVRGARLGETVITGRAMYWDPSTARSGGDASVAVFALRDDRARVAFIHDCVYLTGGDRHPLAAQCVQVLEFMRRHDMRSIAIETNGVGGAMPEILEREAIASGRRVHVQRVVSRANKAERILGAIEPLLGTGRLYAHERVRRTDLMDELEDWTPEGAARDDGIDAVAGALAMTPIPVRPKGAVVRPFCAKTEFTI